MSIAMDIGDKCPPPYSKDSSHPPLTITANGVKVCAIFLLTGFLVFGGLLYQGLNSRITTLENKLLEQTRLSDITRRERRQLNVDSLSNLFTTTESTGGGSTQPFFGSDTFSENSAFWDPVKLQDQTSELSADNNGRSQSQQSPDENSQSQSTGGESTQPFFGPDAFSEDSAFWGPVTLKDQTSERSAGKNLRSQSQQSIDEIGAFRIADKEVHSADPVIRPFLGFHTLEATTYVRWGQRSCPQSSSLVYGGYVGGPVSSKFSNGGSDLLCIPKNRNEITGPEPNRLNFAVSSVLTNTMIVDAMFDVKDSNSVSRQQIACAVCLIESKVQIMIPEGTRCPQQWFKEYDGWLMAASGSRKNRATVNHVCVDNSKTVLSGDEGFSTLQISHVQRGDCLPTGGSSCKRYINARNVPCIVCSLR